MIERKIVSQKLKEYQISEYISASLENSGHSHTKVQRTPLGEKIIISTSRPGIIVGKNGQNIKKLTQSLKKRFNLENPQIEIDEVERPELDAQIVAERIAVSLERFGTARFKGIAHKAMEDTMNAGARGIEIVISGKVPSTRAKSWRFYQGYLKKCGDIALTGVLKAYATAKLKSGVCGVKVSIMPRETILPDSISVMTEDELNAVRSAEGKEAEKSEEEKRGEKQGGRKKEKKEKNEAPPEKKRRARKTHAKKDEGEKREAGEAEPKNAFEKPMEKPEEIMGA